MSLLAHQSRRRSTDNRIIVVDPDKGSSQTIESVAFAALGVQERRDLEEWIKTNPAILGTKLLIITSQYDRFEKSDKRLDLLALDEEGRLVIVELKRDAAGTLADLQAIRYAAFCSTLTLEDVVDLRARYSKVSTEVAEREVREFVRKPEYTKLDSQPRIILAAGRFDDQELTSCVLWLRGFGVDISCVEIAPYRAGRGKRLILVPKVIIPLPQARDYIIGTEKKQAEEGRLTLQFEFWRKFIEFCKSRKTFLNLARPPQGAWYGIAVGRANIHISLTVKVRKRIVGCQLTVRNPRSRDAFQQLEKQKREIAADLGKGLEWKRPSAQGKEGRIAQVRVVDIESRESWPVLFAWLKDRAEAFHRTFSSRVKRLRLEAGG